VRLLGVRVTNLVGEGEPEQMELADFLREQQPEDVKQQGPSGEKLKQLDQALDKIKKKYGSDAVMRASMIKEEDYEEDEE
jgi:DNA polymerase-4